MPEEQDWRLEAELDGPGPAVGLDQLVSKIRGHDSVLADAQAAAGDDVVVTHDGQLLFAYAASEPALQTARRAIEGALRSEGYEPTISVSHWDHELDDWSQVDPPLGSDSTRARRVAVREADREETRTVVCTAGKLALETLVQSMTERAQELGVECKIVEHRHLLTTQVAFTIGGPRRKIDEFQEGLRSEGLATIRADSMVLNPL